MVSKKIQYINAHWTSGQFLPVEMLSKQKLSWDELWREYIYHFTDMITAIYGVIPHLNFRIQHNMSQNNLTEQLQRPSRSVER